MSVHNWPFVLCFFHHVCDGSAQIVEGRTWLKIIETEIRNGDDANLAKNSWVIYMLSLDFQLVLGQLFLWSALGITAPYSGNLTAAVMSVIVYFGLVCVIV